MVEASSNSGGKQKFTDEEEQQALKDSADGNYRKKTADILNEIYYEKIPNIYNKKFNTLRDSYYALKHIKILKELLDEFKELEKLGILTLTDKGKLSLETHLEFQNQEKDFLEIQKIMSGDLSYDDLFRSSINLGNIYPQLYTSFGIQIDIAGVEDDDNILMRVLIPEDVDPVKKYLKNIEKKKK